MGDDSWNRRQLRKLIERVGRLERTQATDREIANGPEDWHLEDGALYIYDDDGNLRTRVGKQIDGTYTIRDRNGPNPPRPAQPEVRRRANGLVAIWDGTFADDDDAPPQDFRYMAVHASKTPGFTPTFETERAAIVSEDGGQAFIALSAGDNWHVALETVSTSYRRSVKSVEFTAQPLTSDVQFATEEFAVTSADTSVVLAHTPLKDSEHLYWHPGGGAALYQDEGTDWSRAGGRTVSLLTPLRTTLEAGDKVTIEYAYAIGDLLYVPLGAVWKYAFGLGGSTAYAATAFDDSGWESGPSPFGWGETVNTIATPAPSPLDVWTRLRVVTRGGALTFKGGVDNYSSVYIDGALVWSVGFTYSEQTFTTPLAAGEHVIAVHGTGDGLTGDYSGFTIEEAAP